MGNNLLMSFSDEEGLLVGEALKFFLDYGPDWAQKHQETIEHMIGWFSDSEEETDE